MIAHDYPSISYPIVAAAINDVVISIIKTVHGRSFAALEMMTIINEGFAFATQRVVSSWELIIRM